MLGILRRKVASPPRSGRASMSNSKFARAFVVGDLLKAQRVRRASPDGSGITSRRAPFCASSSKAQRVPARISRRIRNYFAPRFVLREFLKSAKGAGAHLQTDQELLRAALRFARVPQKPHGAVAALARVRNSPQSDRDGARVVSLECRLSPGERHRAVAALARVRTRRSQAATGSRRVPCVSLKFLERARLRIGPAGPISPAWNDVESRAQAPKNV